MGCGVSSEAEIAVNSSSDEQKSEVFIRLIAEDRNPLAVQLARYFQNLVTECKYRAQGNIDGYERMKSGRKPVVVVSSSPKDAKKHGIGKAPLTTYSVYSVVELFLGYAVLSLQKERWNGAFNYRIEKLDPTTGIVTSAALPESTQQNMLIVSNNKRVEPDPTSVEGYLEVDGTIDYMTVDHRQPLHADSHVRFDFFLLDDNVKSPA